MIVERPTHVPWEEHIRQCGDRLTSAINHRSPWPLSPKWWDDLLLRWAAADDATKVQLFRFVDVMPTLGTSRDVASHLRDFFSTQEGRFPWPLRMAARWADPNTWIGRTIGWMAKAHVTRMARSFVAGSTPEEITEHLRRQWMQGAAFTIDVLGEATVTEKEADATRDEYLRLLEHLCRATTSWPAQPLLEQGPDGLLPRVNLSIKLSSLASHFDSLDRAGFFESAAGRLRDIFRLAQQRGAFINLDMEQYAFKDFTLDIFQTVLNEPEFRDWPNVGIAIQAYLRSAERDLAELLAWTKERGTPVTVRLVKGAYWDYETVTARYRNWPIPVFLNKWESDASFERCTTFLLEHRKWLRPALASHNLRSLAHGLATAERLGVPKTDLEIQMLHGMGDPLRRAFLDQGIRVRIYTPCGQLLPGMAYLVRRLLENSSNSSFVHRAFREHVPPEELFAPPRPPRLERIDMIRKTTTKPPSFSNERALDFSLASHREELASALSDARRQGSRHFDLWIGGAVVRTHESIESSNPAHFHEIVGTTASAGLDHADQAVQAASNAFFSWSRTPLSKRVSALEVIADTLRAHRAELAAWEVLECAKPWREADADVVEAIDFCRYYAHIMRDLGTPRQSLEPGEENIYEYRPRGVTVAIAPWNFPLAILCGMTVAPLVAGNPVIVKSAEQSSIVAGRFIELVREAVDLPPGVLNFLPGKGEVVGARLVEHSGVSVINFTGSRAVGLSILETASRTPAGQRHVKTVLAEMGGKNAIIIDNDADLDEAVLGVVQSAFGYAGQKCSACSRVIALPAVRDAFLARLVDATRSLSIGPPEDPRHQLGPVIDGEAHQRLWDVIDFGKREARVLLEGSAADLPQGGYYVAPHIFTGVPAGHRLAQEEFFGPILTVLEAADLREAIGIANDTDYALTGGIYSRNPAVIRQVAEEFLVGNLYINRRITGAEVGRQPFGGVRLSGTGSKAGGPDYLRHFLWGRTVTENTLRRGFAPESEIGKEKEGRREETGKRPEELPGS